MIILHGNIPPHEQTQKHNYNTAIYTNSVLHTHIDKWIHYCYVYKDNIQKALICFNLVILPLVTYRKDSWITSRKDVVGWYSLFNDTLTPKDYNSLAMAILSQNHREINIAGVNIGEYKVIIALQRGFSDNDIMGDFLDVDNMAIWQLGDTENCYIWLWGVSFLPNFI